MARRAHRPAHLAPVELLSFDRQHWEREDDNGRWQPAFLRWLKARAEFRASHPNSDALGNRLEQIRTEYQAQHTPEHYPPDATDWG